MLTRFSGIFVAVTNHTSYWTAAQWETDVKSMADAGISFLVIPHTSRMVAPPNATCPHGAFTTLYPPTNLTPQACYTQLGAHTPGGTLGRIAAAAAKWRVGLHLGLAFAPYEDGFPAAGNATFTAWGGYQARTALHLHGLYGAAVAGVYTEIEWYNSRAWMEAMAEYGSRYLGSIAAAVGTLPVPRPRVWSSPYSIGNRSRFPTGVASPPEYGRRLAQMAAAAGPHYGGVAMQDSMGAQGNSFQNASDFLGGVVAALGYAGTWANVELFEVWPPDCQWPAPCHGRHPAPFARIQQQMANEAARLGPDPVLIAWEWHSCLSPNSAGDPSVPFPEAARANYDAYMGHAT